MTSYLENQSKPRPALQPSINQASTMSATIRCSARIANSHTALGSVYLPLKVKAKKANKPKAQLRPRPTPPPRENPIKFLLDGFKPMYAEQEWMDRREVHDPIEGERYDIITVDIYFEEHGGACDQPEAWSTEPEMTHIIYLQCIGEMPLEAFHRHWSEVNDRHKGCDAKIHYVVRKVELSKPFVRKSTSSSFCKACGSGVDFMEFCPCQDQCEDDGGYPDCDSDYGSYDQDEEEAPAPCDQGPAHYRCGCSEMHRLNYEWALKYGQ